MMTAYTLPASLDTAAAEPLRQALLARIAGAEPIRLDGAAVTRIGLACLQTLVAARAGAQATGLPFAIAPRSAVIDEAVTLAGLDALLAPLA